MRQKDLHIAVANNKGGAGKTSTIIQLANAFAEAGLKTIVIDGDKNGTCRNWAHRRKVNGLSEKFKVLSMIEAMKYAEEKDIVLYDTEGGISSDEIREFMEICNFIVIPCKPDAYNLEATATMAKKFREENIKFRVLITDAMPNNDYRRAKDTADFLKELQIPFFEEIIPRSMKFVDAGNEGKTVDEMYGSRFITDKFTDVADQILTDIGTKKHPNNTKWKNNSDKKI